RLAYQAPVRRDDAIDEVGLQLHTLVRDRLPHHRHLQGRGEHVELAEREAPWIDRGLARRVVELPSPPCGLVETRCHSLAGGRFERRHRVEAEALRVLEDLLAPDALAYVAEDGVDRVLEALGERDV